MTDPSLPESLPASVAEWVASADDETLAELFAYLSERFDDGPAGTPMTIEPPEGDELLRVERENGYFAVVVRPRDGVDDRPPELYHVVFSRSADGFDDHWRYVCDLDE